MDLCGNFFSALFEPNKKNERREPEAEGKWREKRAENKGDFKKRNDCTK